MHPTVVIWYSIGYDLSHRRDAGVVRQQLMDFFKFAVENKRYGDLLLDVDPAKEMYRHWKSFYSLCEMVAVLVEKEKNWEEIQEVVRCAVDAAMVCGER